METIFIKLLSMSIPASWIILVILLLRIALKRVPRNIFCILWAVAAVRLICPMIPESTWSLIPDAEAIYPDMGLLSQSAAPAAADNGNMCQKDTLPGSKSSAARQTIFPTFAETAEPADTADTSLLQYGIQAAAIIWITGIALFILYAAVNLFKIHRELKESIVLQDNILLCDHISTPFVWGILHPRIILPSSIQEQHLEYVLAHEKAHLLRHDHWWKPLGFALLAAYWFHPLVWAAYKLFCKDIELACDEKVIQNYDFVSKKSYSLALLNCSARPAKIPMHPLAFGEIGVKERIKAIMNYKKPAFGIIFAAAIVCITLSICFLTDPVKTHSINTHTSSEKSIPQSQQLRQAAEPLDQSHSNKQPSNEAQVPGQTTQGNPKDIKGNPTDTNSSPSDIKGNPADIIKNGEARGYLTNIGEDTVTVDLQNWITEESEDWKPEYDRDVGFQVVDVSGEDVTFSLDKNCTFHTLKHHQGPEASLNYKKFKKYCQKMEYPILWFITFDERQRITSIHEQYRP